MIIQSIAEVYYIIAEIDKLLPDFNQLVLSDFEKLEIEKISHPRRIREYLAVRLAIQKIITQLGFNYKGTFKNQNGKPFLKNIQKLNISISHSEKYVMAALSEKVIGVDIETLRKRIDKAAHKFLSDKELSYHDLTDRKITTMWTIKESIFKIRPHKSNDFKNTIIVLDFDLKNHNEINSISDGSTFQSLCFQKKEFCFSISYSLDQYVTLTPL